MSRRDSLCLQGEDFVVMNWYGVGWNDCRAAQSRDGISERESLSGGSDTPEPCA